MSKKKVKEELLPEYDFSKGVRGKHSKRFAAGSNIIVLEPELMKVFPDSESVNETLRAVVKIAKRTRKKIAA
jgi:hypothetical protein